MANKNLVVIGGVAAAILVGVLGFKSCGPVTLDPTQDATVVINAEQLVVTPADAAVVAPSSPSEAVSGAGGTQVAPVAPEAPTSPAAASVAAPSAAPSVGN